MAKVTKHTKMETIMMVILSMAKDKAMVDFFGKMDNTIKVNGTKIKKKALAHGRAQKEIAI
jgi:hypothetical protein